MLDMFGNRVHMPEPCAALPLTDATAPTPAEELSCGAWPEQPVAEPLAEGRQEWPVWTGVSAAGPADWEGLGPLATPHRARAGLRRRADGGRAQHELRGRCDGDGGGRTGPRCGVQSCARGGPGAPVLRAAAQFYTCDQYSLFVYPSIYVLSGLSICLFQVWATKGRCNEDCQQSFCQALMVWQRGCVDPRLCPCTEMRPAPLKAERLEQRGPRLLRRSTGSGQHSHCPCALTLLCRHLVPCWCPSSRSAALQARRCS